jgi:4'-phosphopantetheinyl transferase
LNISCNPAQSGSGSASGILPTMNRIPETSGPSSNEAHVWMFSTEISAARFAEFRNLLSKDENGRADRFRFESDRVRFVASHGGMRTIIGSYCTTRPQDLVFGSGAHGKPFLKTPSVPLQFNLSHSGIRAALAVTRNMRCGIDIEKVRSQISDQALAERFFCERENEWLRSLPAEQRIQGFFRLWSVKESILKAVGKGLSVSLSKVDASSVLAGTSSNVSFEDEGGLISLSVGELHTTEGYTAALAVEGRPPEVRVIELEGQAD